LASVQRQRFARALRPEEWSASVAHGHANPSPGARGARRRHARCRLGAVCSQPSIRRARAGRQQRVPCSWCLLLQPLPLSCTRHQPLMFKVHQLLLSRCRCRDSARLSTAVVRAGPASRGALQWVDVCPHPFSWLRRCSFHGECRPGETVIGHQANLARTRRPADGPMLRAC